MKKTRKTTAMLLCALMVLALLPVTANAETPVDVVLAGANTLPVEGIVKVNTDTITITTDEGGTANISGNSGGKSVVVVGATSINIENETTITGMASNSGLTVPAGSTITGNGKDIIVTSGRHVGKQGAAYIL